MGLQGVKGGVVFAHSCNELNVTLQNINVSHAHVDVSGGPNSRVRALEGGNDEEVSRRIRKKGPVGDISKLSGLICELRKINEDTSLDKVPAEFTCEEHAKGKWDEIS